MATSANITYGKPYTIGKSKLCWFQTCVNDVGRQSGREDMSKTKVALNPRLTKVGSVSHYSQVPQQSWPEKSMLLSQEL